MGPLEEEGFVSRESESLRRLARRTFSQAADVEDLVQDTWALLYERDQASIEKPPAWLRGALRHLVFRKLRRDRLRRVVEAPLEIEPASGAGAPPGGAVPGEPETEPGAVVKRLARTLPAPYREVVDLHYFRNRSIDEIAADLGRPRATVKTQLNRALKLLRQDLRVLHAPRERSRVSLGGLFAAGLGLRRRGGAASSASWSWVPAAALLAAVPLVAWAVLADRRPGDVRAAAPREEATASLARGVRADDLGSPGGDASRWSVGAPPAAPDGAQAPGLDVLCRSATPGEPIAGAPVLFERGSISSPLEAHVLASDEEGRIHLAAAPGRWRVAPHIGRGRGVLLAPEAAQGLVLAIPAGRRLAGVVRERGGEPAGGARVRLSWPGRPDAWWDGPVTGPDGAFEVEADPDAFLLAERDGRTSLRWSVASLLEHGSAPYALELPTPRPVDGVVVDLAGVPVVGARVVSGPLDLGPRKNREGVLFLGAAHEALTEADGSFRLFQVGGDVQSVRVEAEGYAPWVGSFAPARFATRRIVELEPGATLHGRAVNGEGRGIAGAEVEVEFGLGWSPRVAATGPDGAFELRDLPPRTGTLRALAGDGSGAVLDVDLARASGLGELEVELGTGVVVAGTATGADGAPLLDHPVVARPEAATGRGAARGCRTGPDGSFRLLLAPGQPHRLLLYSPAVSLEELLETDVDSLPAPLGWLEGVQAGGRDLRLVALDPVRTARVRGRLEAPAGSVLRLVRQDSPFAYEAHLEDGAFERAGLAPGAYRALLREPLAKEVELASFEVREGADRDLGRLEPPAKGAVRVVATYASKTINHHIRVMLRDEGFQRAAAAPLASEHIGTVEVPDLAPGHYWVGVEAPGCATSWRQEEVRAGETAELVFPIVPGQLVHFRVRPVPALAPFTTFQVRVLDAEGRLVQACPPEEPPVVQGPFPFASRLPLGPHVVEIATADGRRGSVRVDVGYELNGVEVTLPID